MTDPRNVAHDKKVQHDKKNHGQETAAAGEPVHVPQPGKKPAVVHEEPESEAEKPSGQE